MATVPLADELVLLAYDDTKGTAGATSSCLDYGVAGALLLELALAGRISVEGRRVTVLDPTPTGNRLADATLARVVADRKGRSPKAWVGRLYHRARRPVLDGLVESGVLSREPSRVLGIFPQTRYPAVRATSEAEVYGRLRAAVGGSGPVDVRTAALCGLVGALSLERRLFPDLPRRQVKARFKEIGQEQWAAEAVKQVITDIHTAVAATAAVAAASAAGG